MTVVSLKKTTLGRSLCIDGHADRTDDAVKGNLVCAALSIIAQTMAENLMNAEDEGKADIITLDLRSGRAEIEYITDDEEVNAAFDALVTGIELLADRFPETVEFDSEDGGYIQSGLDLCRFDGEEAEPAPEVSAEQPAQTDAQRFNARVREIRQRGQLRQSRILDAAARRYGVKSGDLDALEQAMSREEESREPKRLMEEWKKQEQTAKEFYPQLDLGEELKNRSFFEMLYRGIDLRTAYEIVHRDELLEAAMRYAAKTVREMTAEELLSRKERVRESALSESDRVREKPAALTKKQRSELIKRAERGERIKL